MLFPFIYEMIVLTTICKIFILSNLHILTSHGLSFYFLLTCPSSHIEFKSNSVILERKGELDDKLQLALSLKECGTPLLNKKPIKTCVVAQGLMFARR